MKSQWALFLHSAAIAAAADGVAWTPGFTCPAGAFNDDSHSKYGNMGFEWVGDVVDYPIHHIGNPQSCCQQAGGDGIHGEIGLFYTLCNPQMGCKAGSAYTCTIYANVTGKRPLAGALSGHAQNLVQSVANPVRRASGANNYANPFETTCLPGNASKGIPGDANATVDGQTGATCAPWCGCPEGQPGQPDCSKGFVECPTDGLPHGTTATPQCLLTNQPQRFQCGLVCDPSDPSGGAASRCPKGATCQPLYSKRDAERAGIFNTGVCLYPPTPPY